MSKNDLAILTSTLNNIGWDILRVETNQNDYILTITSREPDPSYLTNPTENLPPMEEKAMEEVYF